MGIVSIGRSLLIKQLLLSGPVVALGCLAYFAVQDIADMARELASHDAAAVAIADATQSASTHIVLATVIAALLVAAICAPVMYLTVGRPLKEIRAAVERLAAGDLSVAIEPDARNDEIGAILRGLHELRDAALARQAQPALPVVAPADAAQDRRVSARNEAFAIKLGGDVQRLATMTKRLSDAAELMIAAAHHANDGSDRATSASTNAAGDVTSVATASEQLLDSIEEISRQVVQSTNVVKAAVESAVDTNAGMGRLSTAAQKVGDVVSLISRIAAQTNLLALNATIEAARAGEAGRGFAVVAQEVKTLATQTAKATQDITGQITEMQEATDLSVEAIDKIQKKISEVEHISTIIAAAVHEQGAATQEIARNVRSAAAGTQAMSSHIENVVRSVGDTSTSAASVAQLAHELDDLARGMGAMIDSFTQSMKAA
jgi:methyl-accepting chemotaxis protein